MIFSSRISLETTKNRLIMKQMTPLSLALKTKTAAALSVFLLATSGWAQALSTNSVNAPVAPPWLKVKRVEKITDAVERLLEWNLRRIELRWHQSPQGFAEANSLGSNSVVALTKRADQSIHMGPTVNDDNFDGIFAHELTHAILFQKYKDAVPEWLQEGLANFISQKVAKQLQLNTKGRGVVNYQWLVAQPQEKVTSLSHPLGLDAVKSFDRVKYRYAASTALMNMLAAKCDIFDLLQLAVGRRLEVYIKNTCGIDDLDLALQSWIRLKSKS